MVDLRPKLSMTASLGTVLWLVALRSEGVEITPQHFLARGQGYAGLFLAAPAVALLSS
jgi:Na+/H+ antiporter NhaD/arsenite permease-like protein